MLFDVKGVSVASPPLHCVLLRPHDSLWWYMLTSAQSACSDRNTLMAENPTNNAAAIVIEKVMATRQQPTG